MWKGDWLPNTTLTRNKGNLDGERTIEGSGPENSFRGGGITLTPLEPMRKWRLQFDGTLCNLVSKGSLNT